MEKKLYKHYPLNLIESKDRKKEIVIEKSRVLNMCAGFWCQAMVL